ncbi:MAG: DUF1552 domain-containing protein [Verrucomicrobiales bacterium]|nr:DUF1552 domain-containing protein [Verrucomicrobiales bacterium]MCP5525486.1 DUF1552 domain-containing protein [Verrucomicrobiales bacterium]
MKRQTHIPRRTFLRGLGTSLALPFLESTLPLRAASGGAGAVAPRRLAFVFIPNGANMADWTPQAEGTQFELPYILEPLQSVREDLLVLSGLTHDKARPNGDGAGDHARSSATFLTAAQARKTDGADIEVGTSVDQVAAQRVGNRTRFRSLELGSDRSKLSGNCDSGYSCAYSFNISWQTPTTPMPPEVDPRQVFERLFSNGNRAENAESVARRQLFQKSILDLVLEDARRLQSGLGYTDRRKLDEYLTAVRELEQRIERAEHFARALPEVEKPTGIPDTYQDHLRILFDLLTLAFQTDTTRIASFMLAHDGSNRPYPWLGVPEGHHDLSHHGNDEAKKEKIAKINRFHLEQFAHFIGKLKSVPEGDGTLLDNCMIVYGGAISDGNRHNHDDLPVLLAGGGRGTIQTGRHVRYPRNTPMANLFLSLLDRMDAPVDRFGDSTGRLNGLTT